MQERAWLTSRIEPIIALLLTFVFGLHTLYLQSHLDQIWDGYLRDGTSPPGALPPPATASLPPSAGG